MTRNEAKKENNSGKYLKKLQDPILIIFIIFWIYSVFMLGFFFKTPIIVSTHFYDDTITNYFWDGNFSIFDIETEITTYDFSADFPRQLSWVFISAMTIFILIITVGIIFPFLKKEISRFDIIRLIFWPTFIMASMIISSIIVFLSWGASLKTDEISISHGRIIMLNLIISIVLILFVLVLISYASIYEKPKKQMIIIKNP